MSTETIQSRRSLPKPTKYPKPQPSLSPYNPPQRRKRGLRNPGTSADTLTLASKHRKVKFNRDGATVWRYRAEARADKKTRKWDTNYNSYF